MRLAALLLLCLMTVSLSGCFIKFKKAETPVEKNPGSGQTQLSDDLKQNLAQQSQVEKFANYGDFQKFLEQRPLNNGYTGGVLYNKGMGREMTLTAPTAASQTAVDDSNAMVAGTDYSTTNLQVAGVDEADIVKTDGQYIYAVVKKDVYIIKAYPADQSKVLVKLAFKNQPQDLYLSDNRLIIYGSDQELMSQPAYKNFVRQRGYTFVKVFDVSDKSNPKQIRDLDFEGQYFDSRMIGDYLYLVLNNYDFGYAASEPLLPRIFQNGEVISNSCSDGVKCFMPDIYRFKIPYENYNLVSLISVNVKESQQALQGELYLTPSAQNMYVSSENIYLTYTKYISEYELAFEVYRELVIPKLSADLQAKVAEIQKTENYILSDSEKQNKINAIIENYLSGLSQADQDQLQKDMENSLNKKYQDIAQELEKTVIQKVAIKTGRLEYQSSGEVPGAILNQFSMDEMNGFLRLATTKNRQWLTLTENNDESYSNVYVLDKELKIVGSLEKLAERERIYAARFMQNRVYLVTYKQTDPLFVIDLKDQSKPKVLGELKIPGFSTYLHPYSDTILIGLGKDTEDRGDQGVLTKGIKLALFDVSDVAKPKEVSNYVLGGRGSDSLALYDHKAFLFSKEKNLLAIPVYLRDDTKSASSGNFGGAAIFKVTDKKIELQGKIEHNEGGKLSNVFDRYGDNEVQRVLFIKDTLYTFSNAYLKLNKLDNLELIKKIEIKKTSGGNDDVDIIK